jgi:hypothetical protein
MLDVILHVIMPFAVDIRDWSKRIGYCTAMTGLHMHYEKNFNHKMASLAQAPSYAGAFTSLEPPLLPWLSVSASFLPFDQGLT